MFLDAGEEMIKSRKEAAGSVKRSLSFSRGVGSDSEPKGAIILSHSKELLNQVYVQARYLDIHDRLYINRATSSLQMKSPIVEFITPDKTKNEKE